MAKDVMCTVESCKFWGQGHRCNASAIEVSVDNGGTSAGYSKETNCHTFETK